MTATLTTLKLPMPMRMGNVNAYLLHSEAGFFLIDTGSSSAREQLLSELANAGCIPGSLRLVLLTHGDFDHTGNAAYLRSSFGVKLAMQRADSGMGESGDMFENRKRPNVLIRSLIPLFTGFGKEEQFSPDLLLEGGDDLSPHGLDARVLSLPGHSKGSIGILTAEGNTCPMPRRLASMKRRADDDAQSDSQPDKYAFIGNLRRGRCWRVSARRMAAGSPRQ